MADYSEWNRVDTLVTSTYCLHITLRLCKQCSLEMNTDTLTYIGDSLQFQVLDRGSIARQTCRCSDHLTILWAANFKTFLLWNMYPVLTIDPWNGNLQMNSYRYSTYIDVSYTTGTWFYFLCNILMYSFVKASPTFRRSQHQIILKATNVGNIVTTSLHAHLQFTDIPNKFHCSAQMKGILITELTLTAACDDLWFLLPFSLLSLDHIH